MNIALFVLAHARPGPQHRLWAARLIGPKSAGEKDTLLRQAIRAVEDADRSLRVMEAVP